MRLASIVCVIVASWVMLMTGALGALPASWRIWLILFGGIGLASFVFLIVHESTDPSRDSLAMARRRDDEPSSNVYVVLPKESTQHIYHHGRVDVDHHHYHTHKHEHTLSIGSSYGESDPQLESRPRRSLSAQDSPNRVVGIYAPRPAQLTAHEWEE